MARNPRQPLPVGQASLTPAGAVTREILGYDEQRGPCRLELSHPHGQLTHRRDDDLTPCRLDRFRRAAEKLLLERRAWREITLPSGETLNRGPRRLAVAHESDGSDGVQG